MTFCHILPFQAKAPWIKHFYIDIDRSDDVTYILPGYAKKIIRLNKNKKTRIANSN